MTMISVSAGMGIASLGVGLYKSIKQSSQANAIDKNNQRPTYTIPDEYKQNVAMANNMARVGMPSQQYNNQLNSINQNQAGGLGALANSANPAAGIASIVRQGNEANGQLNAQDAQARQSNQRYAIGQNAQLGQQQLAAQQYNKFDKYSEGFNQSQALRGAANQNLQNGINGAGQMATNMYGMNFGGGNGSGLSPTDNAALAQNGIAQQQKLDQTANGFNQYLGAQPKPTNTFGASSYSSNPFITGNWGQ